MSTESLNFEQLMQQLETLVTSMEAGEFSLDASLQAYEDGVRLTRLCQQQLAQAEQRVFSLQEQKGQASFELIDFKPTNFKPQLGTL
ncbi:exodeoxyribonuclease VII small subunit [Marinospirillum sp.]|uniref:exodeoxyribonuclease VII small subunit n=1 Tax=Marinospirillum sp. TaxID=2183934 RepID=UPI0039C94A75